MERNGTPFGLLFEERARASHNAMSPAYDEIRDLSFVEDSDGNRVPFVQMKLSGTDTFTKSGGEPTDSDQEHYRVCRSASGPLRGTDTFSEAPGEPTDSD